MRYLSCEFLSIWYFYRSSFNIADNQTVPVHVVSSFQFGIFTEVLSTDYQYVAQKNQLWVPFNLVFLPKFFQRKSFKESIVCSCEFLSIWYFYRSSFNYACQVKVKNLVVSSFQFGIFTEVLSTWLEKVDAFYKLWVPFNLVFLPKFFQRITIFNAL